MSERNEAIPDGKVTKFKIIPDEMDYIKYVEGVTRLCPICSEVMCSCKRSANSICESCKRDWERLVIKANMSEYKQKKRWKELTFLINYGRIQRQPIVIR